MVVGLHMNHHDNFKKWCTVLLRNYACQHTPRKLYKTFFHTRPHTPFRDKNRPIRSTTTTILIKPVGVICSLCNPTNELYLFSKRSETFHRTVITRSLQIGPMRKRALHFLKKLSLFYILSGLCKLTHLFLSIVTSFAFSLQ